MPRKSKAKVSGSEENESPKSLSATGIVKLAEMSQIQLFHSQLREAFASFFVKGHWENWRIKSPEFGDWLATMCYHTQGAVPTRNAIAEAVSTLAGHALHANSEKQVYVRLAESEGAIYIDLANNLWEAVKITGEGWEVVSRPPVRFVRKPGMRQLPRPIRGGKIDDLRAFLNLPDEDHWKLTVAWLIGTLNPNGSFPPLIVEGTHGSAKSTFTAVLRALVDPNVVPLRAAPKNARDLAISAGNSWCLGFDNLSSMPEWLSDALCRLSTGGGFSTRALYTDGDEKLFEGKRPLLLNGIDVGIERADLLDRAIALSLLPISDGVRETEVEFWKRFETIRTAIIGSLFDAVACALRRLPEIAPPKLPRMADFAKWVCAAEPALGWQQGSFLDAYRRNRADSNALALEASTLVEPIKRIVEQGTWQGTATELLSTLRAGQLNDGVGEPRSYPKSARELSQVFRRLAPNLPQIGISVEFGRTAGSDSKRIITIKESGDSATHNEPSAPGEDQQ